MSISQLPQHDPVRIEHTGHSIKSVLDSQPPKSPLTMAEMSKHSPTSTKSRSLPSTPSQRQQSPPAVRGTPAHSVSKPIRSGSPNTTRVSASRTPPAYRRGMMCKYETGMKQARRRVPYTLGPEKLEPDPAAATKKLNAKEEFRITTDMQGLYEQLLPTSESEARRSRLITKLERLLRARWPGKDINVSVFGSTGNQLGTNDSDVDICITTECKEIEHVCSLADLLAQNGMERVVCVSSAKVPIVKVWDPELQVACDMNVNNPIALENTKLIRSYVAIDDRFRPLAMIVKHWAKRRILNDAALGGTLSSYTWICLVLNFLQTRDPPLLPTLQRESSTETQVVGGVNVAFDQDLNKYQNFGKANSSSLGSLLFQFFHYYGHELDFETSCMSVRLGRVIPKSEKTWHRLQDNRLCVEEPFNISRNLANTADDTSVRGIHLELRRACDLIAQGDFDKCCEQYEPPTTEPQFRRSETFIPPTTKAIIPQPPPQSQPQPQRTGRNKNKGGPRSDRANNGGRRSSNPAGRGSNLSHHLRDLPFPMTPQELHIQAQHQQHLLHDQLFQQYQFLQRQEQELRQQLIRYRAASGYPPGTLSGLESSDDGRDSPASSRINGGSRMPMTAPLHQGRFNNHSLLNSGLSSGIVTNPGSPLLSTAASDSRRYARRASVNNAAAHSLRAQSQPARGVPGSQGLPFLTHRFDVPVRQVGAGDIRRSSVTSAPNDPVAAYLSSQLSPQITRYDAGRRPVEYVGYFVGQSPTLSAYLSTAAVSPVPSNAGLAIHHGGLSPRMSARNSRYPSVSASPASHCAHLANGTSVMTPVSENDSTPGNEEKSQPSPLQQSGPLIVDGSINSPPRRQAATRPVIPSSDELDISVTTSEDAAPDTPPSSDGFAQSGTSDKAVRALANGHETSEIVSEREFLSLNGARSHFPETTPYEQTDAAAILRKIHEERTMRELTTALAAATVNNGHSGSSLSRRYEGNSGNALAGPPLAQMTNGHSHTAVAASSGEWQTQAKKNKKRNKKVPKADATEHEAGSGNASAPDMIRRGG